MTNAEVDANFSALRDGVNQALTSGGGGSSTLSPATTTTLGGVIVGSGLSITSGGVLSATGGGGGGSGVTNATYAGGVETLADAQLVATPTTIRTLRAGSGISLTTAAGYVVISSTGGSGGGGGTAGVSSVNGLVGGITMTSNNLSVTTTGQYVVADLRKASDVVLGGIKVGSGLAIDANGTLSVSGGSGGGSTGVTAFNNRTGAVTLTSADVTSALGFTPANSSSGSLSVYGGYGGGGAATSITFGTDFTVLNSGTNYTVALVQNNAGACIEPSSMIATPNGTKFAQDVRPGDTINTIDGTTTVTAVIYTAIGNREWSVINNKLVVTPDHPIKLASGRWAVVDKDAYASSLYQKEFHCKAMTGVVRVIHDLGDIDTEIDVLAVGDVMSSGEIVTTIAAFKYNSYNPTVSILTESDAYIADGIEVASLGTVQG